MEFWFLAITSGSCLTIFLCALPETGRKVVGNGSIAASGIYKSLWSRLGTKAAPTTVTGAKKPRLKLSDLSFLRRLRIMFYKDTAPILLTNAMFYMIYCCVQASMSNAFITIYHSIQRIDHCFGLHSFWVWMCPSLLGHCMRKRCVRLPIVGTMLTVRSFKHVAVILVLQFFIGTA